MFLLISGAGWAQWEEATSRLKTLELCWIIKMENFTDRSLAFHLSVGSCRCSVRQSKAKTKTMLLFFSIVNTKQLFVQTTFLLGKTALIKAALLHISLNFMQLKKSPVFSFSFFVDLSSNLHQIFHTGSEACRCRTRNLISASIINQANISPFSSLSVAPPWPFFSMQIKERSVLEVNATAAETTEANQARWEAGTSQLPLPHTHTHPAESTSGAKLMWTRSWSSEPDGEMRCLASQQKSDLFIIWLFIYLCIFFKLVRSLHCLPAVSHVSLRFPKHSSAEEFFYF